MCAASLFLTADMFKHYKDSANIYKYKLFAKKISFLLCFFFGRGFCLYIYASERGRLVAFLGCWGWVQLGQTVADRGAFLGVAVQFLGAQDVASWRPSGLAPRV